VKLGVIFVPINILYREREIAHIVSDAEPKAVVTAGDLESLARAATAADQQDKTPSPPLDGDAPAAIVYTSGTTGASKGAVLTHNNFAANALNLITCWQIKSADRLLLPLPLFHVHGLGNGLCTWLITGCRLRLLERFEHQKAAEAMLDFRPTLFFGVPTIYVRLLDTPPAVAREIGVGMRLFVSGSAPLPAQVLEDFRDLFGHTILERYGMSETLMNLSNPYIGERRAGTVGFPLPGVSARLLDPEGRPAPDGETGELYLRGPNVFSGYWRNEDATRAAFVDGWFRTGDQGVLDADGYLTLVGRLKELINRGGEKISPREIDEVLLGHPAIAEAVCFGVPHATWGEEVAAAVVLRASASEADLLSYCRERLADFKRPKQIHITDTIPRTATGKIQRRVVAEAFAPRSG